MLNKSLTSLFFTFLGFTLVYTGSILGSHGHTNDFFQRAQQRFEEQSGFNSPFFQQAQQRFEQNGEFNSPFFQQAQQRFEQNGEFNSPFFQQAEERFQESGRFDNPFFRNNISENDNSTSSSRSEAAKKESARKKARAEEMTAKYLAFELAKEQEARKSKEQALKNQIKQEQELKLLAELQKKREEEERKLNEICLLRKKAEQEQMQQQSSGYVRFNQQHSQPAVPMQPSNHPQPQGMVFVGNEPAEFNQPQQLQPLAHVASASDDEFSRPNVAFLPTTMVYDCEQPVAQQQPSEGRKQASAPEKKAEDLTAEEVEIYLQNQGL